MSLTRWVLWLQGTFFVGQLVLALQMGLSAWTTAERPFGLFMLSYAVLLACLTGGSLLVLVRLGVDKRRLQETVRQLQQRLERLAAPRAQDSARRLCVCPGYYDPEAETRSHEAISRS